MIAGNPELRRYGWLEFSPHRLIAMPVVLGLILFIALQPEGDNHAEMAVSHTFGTIFFVLIGLWGGYKAAEAVIEEINDNTWDFQRLSSLSPWQLTIGKLLGSTAYCWYGALMAFAAHVWANTALLPGVYVVYNAALLLCGGLICHAFALLSSLQAAQQRTASRTKMRVIVHHILGLIVGWTFASFRMEPWMLESSGDFSVVWYGENYDLTIFMTGFAAIILLWLVAGIYWQMRAQLRMRSGPWLWTGFVLFLMLFATGFEVELLRRNVVHFGPSAAFGAGLMCCYLMTFLEPWSGLGYRRILDSWKKRNVANVANAFPRWLATFALVFLAAVWIALGNIDTPMLGLTLFSLLAFAARDIALLHFFKFNPESRRATTATLFYLGILYILIPMLLSVLDYKGLAKLFVPMATDVGGIQTALMSGLLQAGIAGIFAWRRWQRYWRQ